MTVSPSSQRSGKNASELVLFLKNQPRNIRHSHLLSDLLARVKSSRGRLSSCRSGWSSSLWWSWSSTSRPYAAQRWRPQGAPAMAPSPSSSVPWCWPTSGRTPWPTSCAPWANRPSRSARSTCSQEECSSVPSSSSWVSSDGLNAERWQ